MSACRSHNADCIHALSLLTDALKNRLNFCGTGLQPICDNGYDGQWLSRLCYSTDAESRYQYGIVV